jgi:hypothetical protein
MIIGTIQDVDENSSTWINGAAMLQFSNVNDALYWAQEQSKGRNTGSQPSGPCLCTVINTNTESVRWWWNGTEQTG